MRDYRFKIEYKMGKRNVIADQLSRPVRMIHGENEANLLGKSKEEVAEMQRIEYRWREMIEYLRGGRKRRGGGEGEEERKEEEKNKSKKRIEEYE